MANGIVQAGPGRALSSLIREIMRGNLEAWMGLVLLVAVLVGARLLVYWICRPVDAFAANVRQVLSEEHQVEVTVYGLTLTQLTCYQASKLIGALRREVRQ